MSKYNFSTKSKIFRIFTYVLIFLVISFVGVSVYLYFNPVDRNIPLENAYFVASDEKYVKLLRNGAVNRNTAKDSDTVTVSNTMMLGLLVDGVESIDLEYYPIDSSTFESVMSKLSLPKENKEVDSTLLQGGDGTEYARLTMNFKKPKTFSGLISTYCNLLNISNCTRKVDLDSWKLEKVNSVNVFNIKDFRNDVLKRGNELFFNNQYLASFEYGLELDGLKFSSNEISRPFMMHFLTRYYLSISNAWFSQLNNDVYMKDSLEYIYSSFALLDKTFSSAISRNVECRKVHNILDNIEKCGDTCKKVLDDNFVKEMKDLCVNYNNYESEYARYQKRMSHSFKETDTFVDTGLFVSSLTDIVDIVKIHDIGSHFRSVLSGTSDELRDFGYWLYNIKNPADKSAVLTQSYTAYIGMVKEMLKEQNYGMCEIANVALDYYNLSKDEKYLKDAKYIRENGNIVEKNVLPTGIDYMSSYYLRESTACADFLLSYYNATGDTTAYVDSLRILADRMNRSLEGKGYAGAFLREGYTAASIEDLDRYSLNFYDTFSNNNMRFAFIDFANQAYILSVISKI